MSRLIGKLGEEVAKKWLVSRGYKILEENFRQRYGEIDLIVEKKGIIIFVEVKFRKNSRFASAEEFVTPRKIKKIRKTAMAYLYKNNLLEADWRLDIVAINQQKAQIKQFENIYTEGMG